MGFVKYFLLYSVCVSALAFVVYGTECVECNSGTNGNCSDPVNTNLTNKCTINETANEQCTRYSYKKDNVTTTIRGCLKDEPKNCSLPLSQLNTTDNNLKEWSCYACNDDDLCNKKDSAASLSISMVALALGTLASLYLK